MKSIVKYQLHDSKMGIVIYYIVIVGIMCIFFASSYFTNIDQYSSSKFSGIEMITATFLFVLGLNSYKENLSLFLQNGIPRLLNWKGQLAIIGIISVGMAMIDRTLIIIGHFISTFINNTRFESMADRMFGDILSGRGINGPIRGVALFFLMVLINMAAFSAGYFITILYYRLNKAGKILFFVGLYGVPFVVYPLVNELLLKGALSNVFYYLYDFAMGYTNRNILNPMVTYFLIFLCFSGFSLLLTRRAVLKN